MSRPRAFSSLPALLLLSLIAFQAASASRIKPQSTPQSTQTKTAVPSRANLAANSKDDLQEPEEPVYGIHEVPEGIVHVPEYDVREPGPSNRLHGSKQRPEDPDGYHTERPPSDAYNKHDGDDSPRDGDAYEKDKSPYGGPEQKPYGPKEDGYGEATPQVPEAPCPKAMSADAVEDGECLPVCLRACNKAPAAALVLECVSGSYRTVLRPGSSLQLPAAPAPRQCRCSQQQPRWCGVLVPRNHHTVYPPPCAGQPAHMWQPGQQLKQQTCCSAGLTHSFVYCRRTQF